ncbi:recombinase family protein [Streptomyces yangpuensis]|uniref:zinc finger domain-containing protein n=1 Tax=Streptomyces yangpuensis TaxID=1648182 RepID=UPI00367D0681
MTGPHDPAPADADDVERHPCPRCAAEPGSPCRSRAGAVAGTYHTGRFTKVPRLAELLRVPLPGMYDPSGPGRLLFAFFAAMAETERENIRESTLEGLDAAARKGKHGGRPPVITDDMLHTVLRRRAAGEPVEQIQPDLIIPAGKRKGRSPSVASIYRALAEHEKKQAHPEAVQAAQADFAALRQRSTATPATA